MEPLPKDRARITPREVLSVAARLFAVIVATFAFAAFTSTSATSSAVGASSQTASVNDRQPQH